MKRIFTLLIFIVLGASVFAQTFSSVRPTLVLWNADGQKVTVLKGRYGITQPSKLTLEMYFPASKLQYYASKNLKLEFRWYYYLSTRKKLVQTDVVSIREARVNSQGTFRISSSLSGVQPGWWEVYVVASIDNKPVALGRTYKYQVFIKKKTSPSRG